MEDVTNYIEIQSNNKLKISPDGDFFRVWVDFLKPVHKLTGREMDVLALYLKERYRLSKTISDEDTLNQVLMSDEIRRRVRDMCGIKPRHINVILSTFRKKGIIKNNRFYPNLIPLLNNNDAGLMIHFNFKNEQPRVKISL